MPRFAARCGANATRSRRCARSGASFDNPARIEALAKRFLPLKPIAPIQFDQLNQLPERPPQFIKPDSPDPIGAVIENLEEPAAITGSVSAPDAAPSSDAASDDANETEAPAAKSGRLDR